MTDQDKNIQPQPDDQLQKDQSEETPEVSESEKESEVVADQQEASAPVEPAEEVKEAEAETEEEAEAETKEEAEAETKEEAEEEGKGKAQKAAVATEETEEKKEQAVLDEEEYWRMQDEGVEYSKEEYEQMLAMYDSTLTSIEEGQVIKGRVIRIADTNVVLDVGFKSEGSVQIEEFKSRDEVKS